MKVNYTARIKLLNGMTILADLVLLNLCTAAIWLLLPTLISTNSVSNPAAMFGSWNIAYLISVLLLPPTGNGKIPGTWALFRNCARTGLVMALVHHVEVYCLGLPSPSTLQFAMVACVLPMWLFSSRLCSLVAIRAMSGKRRVAFVGNSQAMREIRQTITTDRTSKVSIFANCQTPAEACAAIANGGCQEMYCSSDFPPEDIQSLSNCCENNIVRLYLVPDARLFEGRQLTIDFEGDIPLIAARAEPLRELSAQILKRSFDIVFSLAFLATVFPIVLLIVAPLIKRSSPGPIFFSQKRNGLNGHDFNCLKFRTMRSDPSCDGRAATENDPRKFPFGDFLRRHNIDELPQFINVLLGDMSIVGPRPHATWTTDAYRELVNKYMMRLYAKPGITGWAQVNGCRGETKTVDDMVRRIHLDIWYINHWSFALDLRIIWQTVRNMLCGDKGNAY